MRGWLVWSLWALGIILGSAPQANAEIYLWTDAQGVVHMTDQWANVPESARPSVSVRQSSAPPSQGAAPQDQAASPSEPLALQEPLLQMAPDVAQTPPAASVPSVLPLPYDSSVLIPNSRPFIHHSKKPSPPFPYNVRLDPFDRDFVWVGPNRVPRDSFTYPHVSLDTQAQFHNRIRALEQRRSPPQKKFPTRPEHPR
jgi:uncharacterized protein DUF4124